MNFFMCSCCGVDLAFAGILKWTALHEARLSFLEDFKRDRDNPSWTLAYSCGDVGRRREGYTPG